MKKLLISLLIPFALINANTLTDRFTLEVGKPYKLITEGFKKGSIKEYSNLKANIYTNFNIGDNDLFNKMSNDLFLLSDSINSPEAFIIDFNSNIKNIEIKCIKIKNIEKVEEPETCSFRRETENSIIELRRERFYLNCIKKTFIKN